MLFIHILQLLDPLLQPCQLRGLYWRWLPVLAAAAVVSLLVMDEFLFQQGIELVFLVQGLAHLEQLLQMFDTSGFVLAEG